MSEKITVATIRDTLDGMITDEIADADNAVKRTDRMKARAKLDYLREVRQALFNE